VRRDLHRGGAERGQRGFEIRHRPVEVVNLADGFLGADDIQHGDVHAGGFHLLRPGLVGQGGVDGDAQRSRSSLD
jgi:hypothetical protein